MASEIHIALITFRRPSGLLRVVGSIIEQTRRPDCVYLFDNDPGVSGRHAADRLRDANIAVEYMPSGVNVGPAGAAASVMERVASSRASSDAWVMVVNDDIPLSGQSFIRDLERFADEAVAGKDPIGAVGRIGHRFDWSKARLVRPPDHELVGAVDVDYLATGFAPMFRLGAIRDAGPMRADLFIGMTEVEFGLRLRRAGYRLIASADLWRPSKGAQRPRSQEFSLRSEPTWRRYYSMRNLIVILRGNGRSWVALRVSITRGVMKPIAAIIWHPRYALECLRLNLLAVRDAWMGRLGRTIAPPSGTYE